jgi:hypothetical protein
LHGCSPALNEFDSVEFYSMKQKVGLLGALLIATVSGLIIRVIGDPLVEVTSPGVENFFEEVAQIWENIGDFLGESREAEDEGDRSNQDPAAPDVPPRRMNGDR